MATTLDINIDPIDKSIEKQLQHKLDNLTKPVGSLGMLEDIAMQLGLIQQTLKPQLNKPCMITIAGDHGVTEEGISPVPTDITWQQVLNFTEYGGGIGFLCKHNGIDLKVVDAGTFNDFDNVPNLIDAKVAHGTKNFTKEPAMSIDECLQALENGRKIVRALAAEGCNVVGFGEMGIGNTTPASALLSIYCNLPVDDCVGPGCGMDSEGVKHKAEVIKRAIEKNGISENPIENLARFGGFEIATIAGGMLEAAAQKMTIITDGFITTSGLLAAHAINPNVKDYVFYSHQSDEQGHIKMIDFLGGEPILKMHLRLGEGTGAALAYPMLTSAVAMINTMTSFEAAEVTNTSEMGAFSNTETV